MAQSALIIRAIRTKKPKKITHLVIEVMTLCVLFWVFYVCVALIMADHAFESFPFYKNISTWLEPVNYFVHVFIGKASNPT